ncbi:germin-like protein subfamily T member 1 [Typha latifolia]|uniref:germin-like protein subfamily T member 1 n=1 Tax=Typha latifolia TaxID=4733 RepID=UPI003C2D2816
MELQLLAKTLFLLLSITTLLPASSGRDSDPVQDICVADMKSGVTVNGFPCKPMSEVVSNDFFSSAISKEGDTNNPSGFKVTAGNVLSFPGLNTLGLSMNRVDLAVGGINPLHVHPRATELGFVVTGEVLVGFVTTSNVYYSKVIKAGENFVIPRGLMHFELNVGHGKALELNVFDSQLPGTLSAPLSLFGSKPAIPTEVLTKTFLVEPNIINLLKSKFGN